MLVGTCTITMEPIGGMISNFGKQNQVIATEHGRNLKMRRKVNTETYGKAAIEIKDMRFEMCDQHVDR